MSYVDDDMGAFFSGLDEVTVTFNGGQALGHFNSPSGEFLFDGPLSATESRRYYIDLPADAFATLPKPKDTLTVTDQLTGTTSYTVSRRKFSDDGRILTLELAL